MKTPRKVENDVAAKSTAEHGSQHFTTNNFNFHEHKSAGKVVVWVAAVGTALSGLTSLINTARGAIPVPPPTKSNGAISAPKEKPKSLLVPTWDFEFVPLVNGLAESKEGRKQFADVFKTESDHQIPATPGEEAISVLLDPTQDEEDRAVAALYLGGHGKPEYVSPLRIAAKEDGIVGQAARTALEILLEHKRIPTLHIDPGPPKS